MFGKIVSFVIGIYVGIYADQHYKVPKVDDPGALLKQAQEFISKYKKDKSDPPKDR